MRLDLRNICLGLIAALGICIFALILQLRLIRYNRMLYNVSLAFILQGSTKMTAEQRQQMWQAVLQSKPKLVMDGDVPWIEDAGVVPDRETGGWKVGP